MIRSLSQLSFVLILFVAGLSPLSASVKVTHPVSGATVTGPITYAASASQGSCAKGVAAVGVYVNNRLKHVAQGATLHTTLSLPPGRYATVVQEWDRCGGTSLAHVNITVAGAGGSSGVSVTSPANNATVSSPVSFNAIASPGSCAKGVASMGVYVNGALKYVTSGAHLSTRVALAGGPQSAVVQEWDNCGGAATKSVNLNVQAGSAKTLQGMSQHVFVIMLENKRYAQTFGSGSAAPYLAQTLTARGQLLTNYYGIGHNSLDNYVALISGQAPDTETQSDCPVYQNFPNANVFAGYGQAVGQGCVYPSSVSTIANQLQNTGRTWRGYMEGMSSPCLRPGLNQSDPYTGGAANGYATKHNPFAYFHSLVDNSSCAHSNLPLPQLAQDLKSISTTPNLSFIVPNICHDGHDTPCRDGEPGGLVSANAFLQQWVPQILNSPAYKQDGVLIITFDEADPPYSAGWANACCNEMAGPNAAHPGISGPGGGLVGAVILSRFVAPGTRNANPYNHYSLLKTMEMLFGLPYLGYAQPGNLNSFGRDVFALAP